MTYFKNIVETATSVFEGMSITFAHLLRKPVTIQYPDKMAVPLTEMLPDRFRGFLKVDMEICTACLACMNDCPIDCIVIKTKKDEASPTKERVLTQFDIDEAKCMYCGLCTEPCPTGAIHFTKEFERATEDINDLVFKFVPEGQVIVPYKAPKKEGPGGGDAAGEEATEEAADA
jgi:formate hydrogenlyase subunit 6/NADH:ubiquinone oxidoreductase subunit I